MLAAAQTISATKSVSVITRVLNTQRIQMPHPPTHRRITMLLKSGLPIHHTQSIVKKTTNRTASEYIFYNGLASHRVEFTSFVSHIKIILK